jgi:hypothetical protein
VENSTTLKPVIEWRAVVVGDIYDSRCTMPVSSELQMCLDMIMRGPINLAMLIGVLEEVRDDARARESYRAGSTCPSCGMVHSHMSWCSLATSGLTIGGT